MDANAPASDQHGKSHHDAQEASGTQFDSKEEGQAALQALHVLPPGPSVATETHPVQRK